MFRRLTNRGDRKSQTVRFVTLSRSTVASVTIDREKCDLSSFSTVQLVTAGLGICDLLC